MKNFWCDVNLTTIEDNIKKIRERTDKRIIAVVKANAYGLGIEKISEFLSDKVDSFAVSYPDEALRVQSDKDILILAPTYNNEGYARMKENFIITVDDAAAIRKLTEYGKLFRAHMYINTGMNRYGVHPNDLESLIKEASLHPDAIRVEGLYTHLHNTNDTRYTLNQIYLFKNCIDSYRRGNYSIHLLNSYGFSHYNKYCDFDDCIRIGGLLYGIDGEKEGYRKAYQFRAVPIGAYVVNKGKFVGYNNLYRTKKRTVVGVLDVGYIDKFYSPETIFDNNLMSIFGRLFYRNQYKDSIRYHDKPIKIIGSVNMNDTLVDMTGLKGKPRFDVDISSLAADSSVPKRYLKTQNLRS